MNRPYMLWQRKSPGARQAIRLLRQAPAVSNFCNDMVGDMAGTLSGATGAIIVFSLVKRYPALKEEWVALVVVAFISALTVGKGCEQTFFFRTGQRHNTQMGRVLFLAERIRVRVVGDEK